MIFVSLVASSGREREVKNRSVFFSARTTWSRSGLFQGVVRLALLQVFLQIPVGSVCLRHPHGVVRLQLLHLCSQLLHLSSRTQTNICLDLFYEHENLEYSIIIIRETKPAFTLIKNKQVTN